MWLNVALLAPFVALIGFAMFHARAPRQAAAIPLTHADFLGGVLIAMWNYMGWDNLSTIAGEVESPQRTYTRAMFGAVMLVVAELSASGRGDRSHGHWTRIAGPPAAGWTQRASSAAERSLSP